MPVHTRYFWGKQKTAQFNFNWGAIRHDSYVVITASEGDPPSGEIYDPNKPHRFVGDAHFQVSSIAPRDGAVTFWVIIGDAKALGDHNFFNWWAAPLNVWTDITVFDASDPEA
ncbi:MAG TPA: hypothetical protein VLV49_00185 [Terriglobales bacterium]|nr:hypothetical protein [Terriglobales bacterium]